MREAGTNIATAIMSIKRANGMNNKQSASNKPANRRALFQNGPYGQT